MDEKIKKIFVGVKVGAKFSVDVKKAFSNHHDLSAMLNISKDKLNSLTVSEFMFEVKSISRLRWARPCLKRYFYRNVNSRIVEVQPEHMDFVTLLPSQRFRTGVNFNKFSALDVYRDSQKVHG